MARFDLAAVTPVAVTAELGHSVAADGAAALEWLQGQEAVFHVKRTFEAPRLPTSVNALP
jgi:hypothetical protein